jgi:hypothetical protein
MQAKTSNKERIMESGNTEIKIVILVLFALAGALAATAQIEARVHGTPGYPVGFTTGLTWRFE